MINEQEIRRTISIMKPNNEIFEIRILDNKGYTYSGYFKDSDSLIQSLKRENLDGKTVYITLNKVHESVESREQWNKFMQSKSKLPTTSDTDIVGYQWLFIDLDPKRPAGTSSSNEELNEAKEIANKVYNLMQTVGFSKPIVAESGNGVHLLYKIALKNNEENKKLIKDCLTTLDMILSTENIHIDCANFNPSRICKLYGTYATKGRSTEERPHRLSKIISVPESLHTTDIGYLKKLVGLAPKIETPQRYNNYSPSDFNIEEWMQKFGIRYKPSSYSDGTKYVLDCCPFDSNHKGKDAAIFKGRNGALGFRCLHNSCSDKTWRDVRLLFEPDAYEKKQMARENEMYNSYNRNKPKEVKPIVEQDGKPVFLSPMQIYNMPKVDEEFVKTGYKEIDRRMRGLMKGYVSVVSGLRAAAKSSWLSCLSLNAMQAGYNVGCYSGELTAKNFMKWMNLQAAGKSHVHPTDYENFFVVDDCDKKLIAEWMENKFWLFNNDYGNEFSALMKAFSEFVESHKLDLLIIDNLMSLDISALDHDKYEAQTKFILELQKMAKGKNIHIMVVCHPRKAIGFLRADDISGSGNLVNATDNMFIVHRINNDFKRLTKQMFGWKDDETIYQASNCIEIVKDRDNGSCDVFIPLYYEIETKRLKNYQAENIIYGWDVGNNGFMQMDINIKNPFK